MFAEKSVVLVVKRMHGLAGKFEWKWARDANFFSHRAEIRCPEERGACAGRAGARELAEAEIECESTGKEDGWSG